MHCVRAAILASTLLLAGCATTDRAPPGVRSVATHSDPAPILEIDRMSIAVDRAIAMADRHGAQNILVIFDLDSTLLRDPDRSPDLDDLAASDPGRFRQIERTVMYLKSLVPTEANLANQLMRLNKARIPAYLITARGHDMRDMTLREMKANGIVLPPAPECGPPLCIGRGSISGDQVLDAARQAIGPDELTRLDFDRGRTITVWDGVVMAAGLDKGVLMRTLGASLGTTIKGYVFIDDALKNVEAVEQASRGMREEVAIFQYRSPERGGTVRTQVEADRAWQNTQAAICAAFLARWCDPVTVED